MISFALLSTYFFFLAVYAKRFAYLGFSVAGLPVFITEIVLVAVVAFRFREAKRLVRHLRWQLIFPGLFFGWGMLRLGVSFAEGRVGSVTEALQQAALYYQSVWLLVPLLFSLKNVRSFFSVAVAGAAAAQALGWLGFILMGRYEAMHSFLIGFPVGNEMIIPLYPFAFLLWGYPWALLGCFVYGHLWITQFVIYMKRAWVFAVFFFALPVLAFDHQRKKNLLGFFLALLIGAGVAWGALQALKDRAAPIFFHAAEAKSVEQRAAYSTGTRALLGLVDAIFPYSEVLETDVSLARIVFKGDLAEGGSITAPGSLMAFRVFLWKQTWASFRERPWIGQGFGVHIFEKQLNGLPASVNGKWISGPHNSFLSILARMGIVGFGLFLLLLWSSLIDFFRVWRKWESLDWMILAALASAQFFAFFNVCLENPQAGVWYWFFLGAAMRAASARLSSRQ